LPVVPGFRFDLFISYAHLDDTPWQPGADGWVTEFVNSLRDYLKREERSFQEWFDPKIRTGNDFNLAIREAIYGSAVLLCVLSPAYDGSSYCKREITEFRGCPQPAFGVKVGTFSRIQAVLLEELDREKWPPELRTTSPHHFFDAGGPRFAMPPQPDANHPYVIGLCRTRDSILETLGELRRQKDLGTAIDNPYRTETMQGDLVPTAYLADVSDELFNKRENLIKALQQVSGFAVKGFAEGTADVTAWDVSIHMFGKYPGAPAPQKEFHISRVQFEEAIEANPPRPLVWLSRIATARKLFLGKSAATSYLTQRNRLADTFDYLLTRATPRTDNPIP
jgi:hypothetical protein